MAVAGRAVAKMAAERWPEGRVTIICGPGNNGGDGYVAADALRGLGRDVTLYALAAPRGEAAKLARARWEESGGVTRQLEGNEEQAGSGGILVDALFGAGVTRPLDGAAARLAEIAADSSTQILAVDVPSGLNGDTGRAKGATFVAEATLAFERARPGHYLADGPRLCGPVRVAKIGVPDSALRAALDGPACWRNHPACWSAQMAKPAGDFNKYDHGHLLVLGGPPGAGGAARLAAKSALRMGAGLVTLGVEREAVPENAARLDAVMLREIGGSGDLRRVLEDSRINAVLAGPGSGTGMRTIDLVNAILGTDAFRAGARSVVLDADALTVFAENPSTLFARLRRGRAVLTPHRGEFARLFPDLSDALASGNRSTIEVVREAASRAGAVVLLKGPCTLIAAPDGRCALNTATGEEAAPWLATAGTGDVLAGLVAGSLARGFGSMSAAAAAAWVHVEAARGFGPGLTADDLGERIPDALARAIAAQTEGG